MTQKEKIGLNFRFARMKASITIEDFAKAMDDWSPIISNFERKGQAPSFKKFIKWCDALDVSLDKIVYGNDYEKLLRIQNICNCDRTHKFFRLSFGRKLKQTREEKGLSLHDAATLCNLATQKIVSAENGERLSEKVLFNLSQGYEVDFDV